MDWRFATVDTSVGDVVKGCRVGDVEAMVVLEVDKVGHNFLPPDTTCLRNRSRRRGLGLPAWSSCSVPLISHFSPRVLVISWMARTIQINIRGACWRMLDHAEVRLRVAVGQPMV